MKKTITKVATLMASALLWGSSMFGQCTWETMPTGENVNSVARIREDLKVTRSEVFTFSDGTVYHAYQLENNQIFLTPFVSGAWDLSATSAATSNIPSRIVGWSISNISGVKKLVVVGDNGIFTYNISTSTWSYSPTVPSSTIRANAVDMAIHPTTGDIYLLHKPTSSTLKIEKYSGGSWADFGTAADATQNIYYDGSSSSPSTNALSTIGTAYTPQLRFYGSSNDIIVTFGFNDPAIFSNKLLPRANRYDGTSWSKVTTNFNGSQKESFTCFTNSFTGIIQESSEFSDMELNTQGNGDRAFIYMYTGVVNTLSTANAYIMNTTTSEATNISSPLLKNRQIHSFTSDASNNAYVMAYDGSGGGTGMNVLKYDGTSWSLVNSFMSSFMSNFLGEIGRAHV